MTWIIDTDLLGTGGRGQDLTQGRKSMPNDGPQLRLGGKVGRVALKADS